jgi:beta-mannosidase
MGAFFWQLNDCWPVASWSSIDYFGRWKALQYYARRFYADLLISSYAHDGAIDVYVVSDKLQATNGRVHMQLLDFSGKVLIEKTQDVLIPAESSAVYLSMNEKEILSSANPEAAFLVFDLNVDGKRVSRNEVFFDHMRNLDLPLKPVIQSSIQPTKDGYALTLQSPVLARNVYLSFGDLEVTPSDNYFDLLPGEQVVVQLKSPATLQQLQQTLKVISLTDAFFDERPSYREHAVISDTVKPAAQP